MKNFIKSPIVFAILLLLIFSGCTKEVLDKEPLDRYTDEAVWSDINLARSYLTNIYSGLHHGFENHTKTGSFTDEMVSGKGGSATAYNLCTITGDNLGYNGYWISWDNFEYIQKINVFLANIGRVLDHYEGAQKEAIQEQIDVMRGEAFFLRAWEYHVMMRTYGGVPLFSEPTSLEEDFTGAVRATFEETVNFIVADLDEAARLLKIKSEMEMGRANKEAALATKSRVLLFAASDLTADGTAESPVVGYENPDRITLWTAARNAAKAVIDLGTLELADLGGPDPEVIAENYHDIFEARDISGEGIIWARMFLPSLGGTHSVNRSAGPNGNSNYGNSGITGQFVDSYQMIDGSEFFDHFTINANDEYINVSTEFPNAIMYENRDPRFYASVLYDSAVWQPRFPNLVERDPLGIYDRRTRIVVENGEVVSETVGIDTRQGPFDNWNGSYTGYLLKKVMDQETIGRDENNQNIYIYLRYAEVLLNYAEASLELGDVAIAAEYINKIRNRAGMPDFTGDMTEALRYERKIELAFEDVRWFDIRRWKILLDVLDMTPNGIDITQITEDGDTTTTWKQIGASVANNPCEKLYWFPISTEELNRAPGLIQNPGYEL